MPGFGATVLLAVRSAKDCSPTDNRQFELKRLHGPDHPLKNVPGTIFRVRSPPGAPSMPGHRAPLLFRCFLDYAPWNLNHLILISRPLGARSIPAIPPPLRLLVCNAFATDLRCGFAADLLLAKTENRGFPPRTGKIFCKSPADAARTTRSARISAGSDGFRSAPGSGVRTACPGWGRRLRIGLNEMALGLTLGLTT